MDHDGLLNLSEKLHQIAERGADLLGGQIEALQRQHGVDDPRDLKRRLEELSNENRLLNVGIVGRVKAGKSSLLNALFFDGQAVLPKAATPMTAALTTLTYGERFTAEVEFFTEEDLEHIGRQAARYEKELRDRSERVYLDLVRRAKERDQGGAAGHDPAALRGRADKEASVQLRSTPLYAVYDQAQRMKAVPLDLRAHLERETVRAASPEELAGLLEEYVGAKGRFMPFTKTVHIQMPLDALRDIRVIDTPGTNDPVVSREERTVALLKTCDVVFIVSPAGSFLDGQDLELMGRITLKEGVQELVLVASQVDQQLHGSEKRARLEDAIGVITGSLTSRAKTVLTGLGKSHGEVDHVFDSLLLSVKANLLYSSGICVSLSKGFEKPKGWGDDERNAWENLTESYPDYFCLDKPDLSKGSLALLANVAALDQAIAHVRLKKKGIAEKKISAYVNSKERGLRDMKAGLAESIRKQIDVVKTSDLAKLKHQLKTLGSKAARLTREVDRTYQEVLLTYRTTLRDGLRRESEKELGKFSETVTDAAHTYTEFETREKSGVSNWFARVLWGGGKESVSVTKRSIMTSQVAARIEAILEAIERLMKDAAAKAKFDLDRQLSRELMPVVEDVLEDDCEPDQVAQAIRAVVNAYHVEDFSLHVDLPAELRAQGTLHGDIASGYQDEAVHFMAGLGGQVNRRIRSFIDALQKDLPESISGVLIKEMEEQIKGLEDQVSNASQTLHRLEQLQRQVRDVAF